MTGGICSEWLRIGRNERLIAVMSRGGARNLTEVSSLNLYNDRVNKVSFSSLNNKMRKLRFREG